MALGGYNRQFSPTPEQDRGGGEPTSRRSAAARASGRGAARRSRARRHGALAGFAPATAAETTSGPQGEDGDDRAGADPADDRSGAGRHEPHAPVPPRAHDRRPVGRGGGGSGSSWSSPTSRSSSVSTRARPWPLHRRRSGLGTGGGPRCRSPPACRVRRASTRRRSRYRSAEAAGSVIRLFAAVALQPPWPFLPPSQRRPVPACSSPAAASAGSSSARRRAGRAAVGPRLRRLPRLRARPGTSTTTPSSRAAPASSGGTTRRRPSSRSTSRSRRTRKGLELGDPARRVTALYGPLEVVTPRLLRLRAARAADDDRVLRPR